jgi:uncharacterized membrane protein required for colicin V production
MLGFILQKEYLMWKEFVKTFGWRFSGVDGYQFAPMWVEELKTWFDYHEAQQSVQLTALRRGLVASIFINVILLVVVAFTIGGN